MLKISKYIPIIIPIVMIGGLFFPYLGYILLLDMLILMIISPFKGRFFCGNLCSRGLFNEFVLNKISRKVTIPKLFFDMRFRIIVLTIMMSFMIFRIIQAKGVFVTIGAVLVSIYIVQTLIISILAVIISPRAWCQFCPAGTIQRFFDRKKYILKANISRCNKCGACNKVCPMGIKINEILHHPDCIKCGKCIKICPRNVLRF